MQLTLSVVAIAVAGLMAGNELAVSLVHRMLWRLPDAAHAAVASALARLFGRLMPFWYAATLLLTIAVAFVFPWSPASGFVVGAAVAFAATIALAAVVLTSINNQVAAWKLAELPPDWQTQRRRWDRLHAVRLVLLAAGLLSLISGVLLKCRAN